MNDARPQNRSAGTATPVDTLKRGTPPAGQTDLALMSPPATDEEPNISPRMTAVFGGLFGLATVASIVALLIQAFPVRAPTTRPSGSAAQGASAVASQSTGRHPPRRRVRKILPGPWRAAALADGHLMVKGTLNRRSFITALGEAGVPKAQVYRIIKSFEGVHKFDHTGRTDRFVVALTRGTKRAVAFEYQVSPTEIYQSRTGKDGLLHGRILDMKVRHDEYAAAFYIGKDLVASYARAGFEKGLIPAIDQAFNGRTSHEAFEEGGVVRAVVVETTALGRFVRYEHLRAIEYRSPDPARKPVRAYWFEGSLMQGYVDDKGRHPSKRGWRSPIPGAPVTSRFNLKRMHPILHRIMPHTGTDFGAPMGTPVRASRRGTVALLGRHGASGNLVLIDHEGGIQTGYAHLSRFAKGLKKGSRVGTLQLVGYVGSTGRSTGPHLHFTAKRNGKFFDALELKLDAVHLLPVSERTAFLAQKRTLDAALERIGLPEPPPPEPEPVPQPPANPAASGEANAAVPAEQSEQAAAATASASNAADSEGDDLIGADLGGKIE